MVDASTPTMNATSCSKHSTASPCLPNSEFEPAEGGFELWLRKTGEAAA